jgi:hypothetical protein
MDYPHLLLAIRCSGRHQYQLAHAAGIREGRLSEIVRRGGATAGERQALSRALGVAEAQLFRIGREGEAPERMARAKPRRLPSRAS